jgi:hypothetical protein
VGKKQHKQLGYFCNPKIPQKCPIGKNSTNSSGHPGAQLQSSKKFFGLERKTNDLAEIKAGNSLVFFSHQQGDQIGRIFAYVHMCQLFKFFEKLQKYPKFLYCFLHGKEKAFILENNVLGYILVDFFHKLIWSPCTQATHVSKRS